MEGYAVIVFILNALFEERWIWAGIGIASLMLGALAVAS